VDSKILGDLVQAPRLPGIPGDLEILDSVECTLTQDTALIHYYAAARPENYP